MEKETQIIIDSIKTERKLQKVNGSDLSGVINMTQAGYSQIETGKRNISLNNLVKICGRLGITISLTKKIK